MAKYIDADTLIKRVKDLPTWWADGGGYYGGAMKYPEGMFEPEDVISIIENAPAADVAPVRHGKWVHSEIEDDDWGGTFHEWTCSVCGYSVGHNPTGENYCPNCGAKIAKEVADDKEQPEEAPGE